jgi:hypothetical protein
MLREPPQKKGVNPFTWGFASFVFSLVIGIFTSVIVHGYFGADLLTTAKKHVIVIPVLYFVARVIRTDKQKEIVLLSMAFLVFLMGPGRPA